MKNVSLSEAEKPALIDKEAAGLLNSTPGSWESGCNSLNRSYATLMDIFQDSDLPPTEQAVKALEEKQDQ